MFYAGGECKVKLRLKRYHPGTSIHSRVESQVLFIQSASGEEMSCVWVVVTVHLWIFFVKTQRNAFPNPCIVY